MNEVYAVQYKSAIYRGRLTGRLKLSSVSTGKYVIPYFLADFKREHPDVEISLDVTNKSSVIAQLENNEVDFALVSILPDTFAVSAIDLMDNELYLIGAGHSEISSVQFADLADNRKIPLIYREHGSGTARTMEQFLSSGEVLIPQTMRLTSNETVKQAVLAGLGYSVMPLIGITNELKDGRLKIIECPGLPIKTKWRLITLARKKLSPVAEAFSEFVGKEKDRIITERFALPGNIPGLQKH
jgi:LysR family transcriptional regulator, low CO2-responsive transcriptional regulator